ncbi:ABC transporter ATP-binding protein [Actinoalloteichus caeruleus]|uniref:ABC transporter ATP-binding protein n=1 Tax=Actinoalloteichus cyanogriseus TaxID=2893586 RepID=UPI0005557DAB|nr:ATP-binding cassette domain-containing protein [Actinoalloteichus caeruleus]
MTTVLSTPLVKADELRQQRGRTTVLHDIDFSVDKGVTCLLGPNGAGKTTLLETIVGVLSPQGGSLLVCGQDVSRPSGVEAIRASTGYLPQRFTALPSFSTLEFVSYTAWSKGLSARRARENAARVLGTVGLAASSGTRTRKLSGGMLQRLGIACALVNEPALLVLDEPTVGLDPAQRASFRALVRAVGKETPTVLSTHLTDDVAAVADSVLLLSEGHVRFQGTLEEFLAPEGADGSRSEAVEAAYLRRLAIPAGGSAHA